MTDEAMSPLRRRMIEDMSIRKFAPKAGGVPEKPKLAVLCPPDRTAPASIFTTSDA